CARAVRRGAGLMRPPCGPFKPHDFQQMVAIKATALQRKVCKPHDSWGKRAKTTTGGWWGVNHPNKSPGRRDPTNAGSGIRPGPARTSLDHLAHDAATDGPAA